MVLHARGLEELGVRVTLVFDDSSIQFGIPSIAGYARGLRLLGGTLGAALGGDPPDVINVDAASAPTFVAARHAGLIGGKVVAMSYAASARNLSINAQLSPQMLRVARSSIPPRVTMRFATGGWSVNREDRPDYIENYGVSPDRARIHPARHREESFYERPLGPRAMTWWCSS